MWKVVGRFGVEEVVCKESEVTLKGKAAKVVRLGASRSATPRNLLRAEESGN